MKIKIACVCILTLLLGWGSRCYANFDLAMKHYSDGDYAVALKEFKYLASIGISGAQFNLGVMYYRGQGVEQDIPLAYAWMYMAGTSDESKWRKVAAKVYATLSEQEKQQADKRKSELESKYGKAALEVALAPEYTSDLGHGEDYKILKKTVPQYPRTMRFIGKVGWVDVMYSIAKDGTTRNQQVLSSSDEDFSKPTVEAIKQWIYKPAEVNGKPVEVHGVTNRFVYSLEGVEISQKRIANLVKMGREKAVSGNALDTYRFANFLSGVHNFSEQALSVQSPNYWYFKAAKSGFGPAEFKLGQNMLVGKYCSADVPKSLDWLYRSANHNYTEAQYFLAIEMLSGARLKKDIPTAISWLTTASELGNNLARLKLAWIMSTSSDKKLLNPETASNLFKQVSESYTDQITYLEVGAAVHAINGDFKGAVQYQTGALNEVKRLKLPETPYKEKLSAYQARRAWSEEL